MESCWKSIVHCALTRLTRSLRSFFKKAAEMESSLTSYPGILDLPPEVRIIIWQKLSPRDQKIVRVTCSTFLSDIDGLVGVHGILDGTTRNVDWISQVRLQSLHVVNRKPMADLSEKLNSMLCFSRLGRLLNEFHCNLPSLSLNINTFNMDSFEGRLRHLEISTSGLYGKNLKELAKFLERQHRLTKFVCELPTVNWSFYLPVLTNCRHSLETLELNRIPTMSLSNIDILDWIQFPVIPNLQKFKLHSSTSLKDPYPLQCLHTINFPIFCLIDLCELELVNVKLREVDIWLILDKIKGRLRHIDLRYYLTRIRDLHERLEPCLRDGRLKSLTLCDNLPVTSDQLTSNDAFCHSCRQYGYTLDWKYHDNRKGYGYKFEIKRNQKIFG